MDSKGTEGRVGLCGSSAWSTVNFNGSNIDGLFTVTDSNSLFYGILMGTLNIPLFDNKIEITFMNNPILSPEQAKWLKR